MKKNKKDNIIDRYFEYLCGMAGTPRKGSYRKLLMRLHDTAFYFSMGLDEDRAQDGINLRYKFAFENGIHDIDDYIYTPCSVLEMMVALAYRMDEQIMYDDELGDRTGTWFWGMVKSLGLFSMTDDNFDRDYVDDRLAIFMDRHYDAEGHGGLFTVEHGKTDMRELTIWYQMNAYLNTIV